MNLFVTWWKDPFFVSGAAATEEVICPLSSPIDLLLPKGSFVFVTKLRAPAPNQQALQSSFLYHNLQIIISVRKSCSGDYRSCLQTQCHHKLMPISRQWGLCSPDLAEFQPIQRQGQDTSKKCHAWLFSSLLLHWKCTLMPKEVDEMLCNSQLNVLAALCRLWSSVTAFLGTLPAVVLQGVSVTPLFACRALIDITGDFRHGLEGNRWPQVLQMSSCFWLKEIRKMFPSTVLFS